jgi:hypothetical protein
MVTFNAVPAHDTAASVMFLAGVSLSHQTLSSPNAVLEALAGGRPPSLFATRGGDAGADCGGTSQRSFVRPQCALTGGSRT